MTSMTLSFQAIDTLFFRELRPHGAPGGMQLQSVFPPPARTLEGAVRTLLHDLCGAPGQAVQRDGVSLTGDICMRGPYLVWHGAQGRQRLYPWPAHIMRHAHSGQQGLSSPAPTPTLSDLGKVYLPQLHEVAPDQADGSDGPAYRKDFHAPHDAWLSAADFFALLAQPLHHTPQLLRGEGELYWREARLGIARNSTSRTAQDGQLYQTSHIRPAQALRFALHLSAAADNGNQRQQEQAQHQQNQQTRQHLLRLSQHLTQGQIVRLGAEGRCAYLQKLADDALDYPLIARQPYLLDSRAGAQLALVFTTAADFCGDWKPANFQPHTDASGATTWRGYADAAQGIALEIVSVVAGKYQREGGWDSAAAQARPARAPLPAGSVWFCRVLSGDINQLQGAQLGVARELGRGEIALAAWR